MKKLLVSLIFIPSILFSQSSEEKGKQFINSLLVEKSFEKAYSFFDETIKTKISETVLKDTEAQLESQLGSFKTILEVNKEGNAFYYYSDFEKMKLDINISFNQDQKIIGFFFVPHKEFKKEKSLGNELSIKSGVVKLNGTLLVPEKNNQKKLVLFIHGSGPNDRDETIYENKPFKDIAESLYEKGISSYRFDKRTLSNPESFNDNSTIDDEVTNDVLSIINYFKSNESYKQYEIILIGHSLGGYLLPHIFNKSKDISKIIFLAGNARPLDNLIVEQYEYLNKISPSPELQNELKKMKEQVAFLNSKAFNLNAAKEKLPFGLSANYWKSLLDYNCLNEAQKINIPVLVLQGERDYQVLMTDFELWKKALKSNKKAEFISYPKLNHLFISGENISEPKEYSIKGSVDLNVINDINNFIKK